MRALKPGEAVGAYADGRRREADTGPEYSRSISFDGLPR
jgi:hypothetical protein